MIRRVTNPWREPTPVDDTVALFGGGPDLFPAEHEIPAACWLPGHPFARLGESWDWEAGRPAVELVTRHGVDRRAALRHLAAVMHTFTLSQEYKRAAVCYLAGLWFEAESLGGVA